MPVRLLSTHCAAGADIAKVRYTTAAAIGFPHTGLASNHLQSIAGDDKTTYTANIECSLVVESAANNTIGVCVGIVTTCVIGSGSRVWIRCV